MKVKTGFGYFVKDFKKISKYELPVGEHQDPSGCSFVEVPDKATLDSIVLDNTNINENFESKLQIQANRNAFIDALMAGDEQKQTDLKDAQSFLVKKVKE
jgi:hypothetical protein